MTAATMNRKSRLPMGRSVASLASAARPGCADQATTKKASSKRPIISAARSTLLYEPLATMKSKVAAASGRVKLRDSPNSSPIPATPVNSVTSDPMTAAAKPRVERQAHPRPNRARINSPWPRPV